MEFKSPDAMRALSIFGVCLLAVSCASKKEEEAVAAAPVADPNVKFDPGKGEKRVPPRPSIFGSDPGKPGFVGVIPFQQLPIPPGSFKLVLNPTEEITGQTRVPVYVISDASRNEWDTVRVSEFLLSPKGKFKKVDFGSAPGGKKSSQTLRVPFEKGDKFVVIIADLPGRFEDAGGTRDERMAIVELEMDYTDPEKPVGKDIPVAVTRNALVPGS